MGGCMIKLKVKINFFGEIFLQYRFIPEKKKNLDFEADSTDCLT